MSKIKVKNILISQPQPIDIEKSPFFELSKKFNLKIDYKNFFKIERLTSSEFREQKVYLQEYLAIIFTSRQAVDHYFSMSKDMRYKTSDNTKYFCMSEAISLYLQKYIQFRKRKIFACNNNPEYLACIMKKFHNEVFLLPCSDGNNDNLLNFLTKKNFRVKRTVFFRPISDDLSVLDIDKYDLLVFFSPFGILSLKQNFPDYEQKDQFIGAFGELTSAAIAEAGFTQHIIAPTKQFPSMTMAIDDFLTKLNKRK